jgi:hypothetical protein
VLSAIQSANLALRFLLELCLLAAIGYWGFNAVQGRVLQIVVGLGAAALVAVIWGIWLAPASSMRLQGGPYVVLEVVLFVAAVAGLALAGQPVLAWILGALALVNGILLAVWQQ